MMKKAIVAGLVVLAIVLSGCRQVPTVPPTVEVSPPRPTKTPEPTWTPAPAYFRGYYSSYEPLELSADALGDFPLQHHLNDVPWIATEEAYCQSNSLQMIAAQKGIEKPRGYFDFLMGFTYGAIAVPRRMGIGFFPRADPETGFIVAAPYLGLVRRYYVTDDPSLYLDALRYYLSQGYPARVGLNPCTLHGEKCQGAHSEVLVGYDETSFYYYETVTEPHHLPPGEEGLPVSDQTLLDAVLGQAQLFTYPWHYSLTIFKEGPVEDDLTPIWARNGRLLIQGWAAIGETAFKIEKRGVQVNVSEVRFSLKGAVYSRRSNAAYLRGAFAGQADIERAADSFDKAADLYAEALAALEDGVANQAEAEQVADMLRSAATLEQEIGRTFLAQK